MRAARVRRALAGFALLLVGVLPAAVGSEGRVLAAPEPPEPSAPEPAPPQPERSAGLVLIAQDAFTVDQNGAFGLTVQVPSSVDLGALADPAAGGRVRVSAFGPITTRDAVPAARAGTLAGYTDAIEMDLASIVRPAADQLTIPVRLETDTKVSAALRLGTAGVYALVVDLRRSSAESDEVLAQLVTFVQRDVVAEAAQPAALAVAVAVGAKAPVTLDSADHVVISDAIVAELTKLVEILETSEVPVAVQVAPLLLISLHESHPELASRLDEALANAQLLSAPSLPLDPSAAAAAGQGVLYSRWLVDGEDLVASSGMRSTPTRAAVMTTEPLSEPGAALLRSLGTRLLLLTPTLYDTFDRTTGIFTDYTQLVHVQLADDTFLDGAIVDRRLGAVLGTPSENPLLDAIATTAELLGLRREISERGSDPRRHTMVLGTDQLGLPDVARLAPLTRLIAETPGLEVTTVSEISARTTTMLNDGRQVEVGLPPTTDGSIQSRIELRDNLSAQILHSASMLTEDDPRGAAWVQRISSLPSSAVSDEHAQQVAGELSAEFAAVRAAVESPMAFNFTLTGRSGSVRLRFRNTSVQPLQVRLRLGAGSNKLTFPENEQVQTLLPNTVTEIEIPMHARSNGRFPVYLDVLTPSGDPLARVVLTATVTALSGWANLATGAALLILLTWWAHHIRTTRRRRRTAEALGRHPVSGLDAGSAAGESDEDGVAHLSPDAATSTLPHS